MKVSPGTTQNAIQPCLNPPQITTLSSVLIDYYVAATDSMGNIKKTDIYHVFIGNGTALCED